MKKIITFALILLTAITIVACKKDAEYKGLDKNVSGEISVMLWSGDNQYHEDVGHKDWKPEDISAQNVATVYAVAKAFNEIYPNVKISVYAKSAGPDDGIPWSQEMENFKLEHGKYPDLWASTDLAGDIGKGLVANLSQFSNDPMYKSFNKGVMSMMNYYGFQAGLPQFLQPWGIYINKELAEQNNIDVPEPDWTIDEYTRFIKSAPGGDEFYGAMDANMSIINTGTTTINYQILNHKSDEDYVNINSEEVRTLLSEYFADWAESAIWPASDAGILPAGYQDRFGWWSHNAFTRNLVLTNDNDPWMMGDAAHPNPAHTTRAQSEDWDIYPRPSTEYRRNTVGVVLDPIAVHNYCADDGNYACTDEENAKIKLAYTFASFWVGDSKAWQARADQQFLDNGILKSAMNDSLPFVTGKEFEKQMEIWYSPEIHQRFRDKEKMPGWHYILEIWEKGDIWDISDKAYPLRFTEESGTRRLNLYEWNSANTEEIAQQIGVDTSQRRLAPNFVEAVLSHLEDWNELANQRFAQSDQDLRNGLKEYYGYTDKDFE